MFNFRFATASTDDELKARVDEIFTRHGLDYDVRWSLSAAPFVTGRGALVDTLTRVVLGVTGTAPQLSTSGGTSDGRFLATIAHEVAELGPLNESIHKVDERVSIADLERLSVIYEQTLVSLLEGHSS
jgi:succinyl-diaminopimelate desuccinylase